MRPFVHTEGGNSIFGFKELIERNLEVWELKKTKDGINDLTTEIRINILEETLSIIDSYLKGTAQADYMILAKQQLMEHYDLDSYLKRTNENMLKAKTIDELLKVKFNFFEFTRVNSWSNLFDKMMDSSDKKITEKYDEEFMKTYSHYTEKYIELILEAKGFGVLTKEHIDLVLAEETLGQYKQSKEIFLDIWGEKKYDKKLQEKLEKKTNLMQELGVKEDDLQQYFKAVDWNFRRG